MDPIMTEQNKLFIDECGYTGEDLFNEDQPVFVLATLWQSETHCIELKNKYFSRVQAKELKHSRLSKYPAQQAMVIDFLRHMAKESDSVKFGSMHKHFALITKMVDLLIETMAHDDGLDFYKDGLNIAFSNMLYFLTKSMAGEEFFKSMILNFQLMMRERTHASYEAFFRPFFEIEFEKELDEFFDYFRAHHLRYGFKFLQTVPSDSLEISFAEAFNLVAFWSRSIEGNFSLIHDNSSNMAKNKKAWDTVLHPDVPFKVVGYDRRKMYFPIRAEKTVFENSRDFAGLQLADILAGAMARCMKWNMGGREDQDDYAKELTSFLPDSFGGHGLWPNPNVTPEDLGTTGPDAEDAIEHFIGLTKDLF